MRDVPAVRKMEREMSVVLFTGLFIFGAASVLLFALAVYRSVAHCLGT